jgi:hypothetical protein
VTKSEIGIHRALTLVLLSQLLASAVLVVVMASRSPINAHPDEDLHLAAGEYFVRHWVSPPVGAPGTARAYSHYGMSYLDSGDIVYWFLGKAAALGQGLGASPQASMRGFQVLLYLILVSWVLVRARTFVPALGFLLLTPQIWYVFSYVNGDALPFLLLAGVMLEFGWPESGARRYLDGASPRPSAGIVGVGALLGLLALSKLNYLVTLGFVAYVLVWLKRDTTSWKLLAIPLVVAAAIALPWVCHHALVNDFQTGRRVLEHAEKVAAPEMTPSMYANLNAFPFVGLRAKGVPLTLLFTRLNWLDLSFQSFSGLYGWMRIFAKPWVYATFAVLDALLVSVLVFPVLLRGLRSARFLLAGVLGVTGLVLVQSVYQSWVRDFQAQGRYLFPALPVLFFYWRQCEEPSLRRLALLVTALLGGLSLFSFGFVGLVNLA